MASAMCGNHKRLKPLPAEVLQRSEAPVHAGRDFHYLRAVARETKRYRPERAAGVSPADQSAAGSTLIASSFSSWPMVPMHGRKAVETLPRPQFPNPNDK